MKKVLGLLGSLLVFAGAKAQTPTVKKETVKPVVAKPSVADSLKAVKGNTALKLSDKAIKFDKTTKITLPMKEKSLPIKQTDAVEKPQKH